MLTLTRANHAPVHEIDLREPPPEAAVRQPAPGPMAYGLAALSLAAAAIHAAFVPDHLQEAWIFGAFFIACTVLQFAHAYLFATSTARWVYAFGLTNLVVMFVWLVARTTGVPFGPMPWVPEAVGVPDMLCGLLEGAIVVRCAWLLAGDHWRWKDKWTQRTMTRLAGVVGVIGLATAVSLTPPFDHHHHPAAMTSDAAMRRPGMATSIGGR